MSFAEAIVPYLPGFLQTSAGLTAGITGKQYADASADRLRQIGEVEGVLRQIQKAELLGAQSASYGARGVTGGTQQDIDWNTNILEQHDVARAQYRYDSLAAEAERRGQSKLIEGIVASVGGLANMADVYTQTRKTTSSPAPAPTIVKSTASATQKKAVVDAYKKALEAKKLGKIKAIGGPASLPGGMDPFSLA